MRFSRKRYALTFLFALCFLLGSFVLVPFSMAQVTSEAVVARRQVLNKELERIETEIRAQSKLLVNKRQERVSIERDVGILDAEIRRAQLSIRAREIEIQNLSNQIGTKEGTLNKLDSKLDREKESLAQLLRKTNSIDDFSLVEVVLSNKRLSDFFEDLDTFDVLKSELQQSFVSIAVTKNDTQAEKYSLEGKRTSEVSLRNLQNLEKRKIEDSKGEKRRILRIAKGQEQAYQGIIAAKEKTAAEIRAELFALRGSSAIPFEKALEFANVASKETGVRPALILGVIAQESRLGEFIGTGNWRVDMKNPRDTVPFLEITKRLGLDPDKMPVSAKPSYGWGGAMGPAQFIPSTWVLYEDRIAKLSKQNPPNPWDARTAFFASGLLLSDNGADRGTRASERLAALRYFAGWRNASKPAYAFYGDGVIELADKYQRQIDILAGS